MNAVDFYRVSYFCHRNNIPIIPKIMKIIIFILFNSIIPSTCRLGKGTRFMYGGIGCVIHSKAVVGDRVCLGQGITIGRKKADGAPIIGNDVYIAAGSRILGDITIGDNVIIGANSVVLKNIPPNSIVAGVPAKVIGTVEFSIWDELGDIL